MKPTSKLLYQMERKEKSAIAEHAWGYYYPILVEGTKVLDQATNNNTLLIKEAFHIFFTDSELINRDKDMYNLRMMIAVVCNHYSNMHCSESSLQCHYFRMFVTDPEFCHDNKLSLHDAMPRIW